MHLKEQTQNQIIGYTNNFKKVGNPNEFLGIRKDLTPRKMSEFAKSFRDAGATILGGCCETRTSSYNERDIKLV